MTSDKEVWTPSYSDIEWTKNLISTIKEGGSWVVPASKSIWTFSHENKTAKLVGDPDDETNQRIQTVLVEYLGYEVSS